jgi:acyl-coenzyme A synthetase/AMP-(fatty) acid ligase
MRSLFGHPRPVEHHDQVGHPDSGKPVGDRWRPDADGEAAGNGIVPIGRPLGDMRCLLTSRSQPSADHEGDQLPADDEGELCMTGSQTFSGYLGPADGAGRFLEHGGLRWYRTVDRVRRLATGELAYIGRLDHQVKVRGYRVELLEVERALRDLDEVSECAVVAVRMNGETELVATYAGEPAAADDLARHHPGTPAR